MSHFIFQPPTSLSPNVWKYTFGSDEKGIILEALGSADLKALGPEAWAGSQPGMPSKAHGANHTLMHDFCFALMPTTPGTYKVQLTKTAGGNVTGRWPLMVEYSAVPEATMVVKDLKEVSWVLPQADPRTKDKHFSWLRRFQSTRCALRTILVGRSSSRLARVIALPPNVSWL